MQRFSTCGLPRTPQSKNCEDGSESDSAVASWTEDEDSNKNSQDTGRQEKCS